MQDPRACSKGAQCSCSPPPAAPSVTGTDSQPTGVDRRKFLTGTAAIAVAGSVVAQDPKSTVRSDLFLKEEHWRDRMRAPDDGKKYGWVVDVRG